MAKGDKRRPGEGFEDGYDRIFDKNRPVVRGKFVWDEEQGKMVSKSEFTPPSSGLPHIQADIEPFRSPIDGRAITSRSKLRDHNKQHGVTNARDYGPDYYKKAAKLRQDKLEGNTAEQKRDRINTIRRAVEETRR